jgi:ADP-heptose:LPS heptosyltransferase
VVFPSPKPFRKKKNWLTALAVEGLSPVLRSYALGRTGPPSDPREWRRALIIGDNHIGDLLYRSASLAPLKAGLPECEFHYLAAPGTAQVLQGNPALASVLPWARSDSPLDLSAEHFDGLAQMQFDAALCTNCIKYWPELRLALRLGIPNRAGYVYKGFSGWVTDPIPLRYPQPFAAYFRDYVASLTGQDPQWPVRPVIYTDENDEAEAGALWSKLDLDRSSHVTAAFVTSRQPTGIWPVEKFGETLKLLTGKTRIVLCGAATDETLLRRLDADYGLGAEIAAGSLGIRALCRFLARCSVVLTTDSGPRHIANAAGVPVVFVRNTWFNATEAGVYVETEHDLCSVAENNAPASAGALLEAIHPERAAAAVLEASRTGRTMPVQS